MNPIVPVVLSSVFAAGCAALSHGPTENPTTKTSMEPPAPSQQNVSVDLRPPFTSLRSIIHMRPFRSTKEGAIMTLEAVIGQDKNGQTWGCAKIYDDRTKTALTPSEYEEQENTLGQIEELPTLHGRECAPVEAQLPESNPIQSVPSTPSRETLPDLDAEGGSRAVPKAPLLHL